VDISFKDDVTVILLVGVPSWLKGHGTETPFLGVFLIGYL
jgi:hypothetical protein